MFDFTVQHVLILRVMVQFGIDSPKTLHNFLFLASAESFESTEVGFYDFVRTRAIAFSPGLQAVLEDLVLGNFVTHSPFGLTHSGRETYYALSGALRTFEDYLNTCFRVYFRHKGDFNAVNWAPKNHLSFRRAKAGRRIFEPKRLPSST